MVRRRIAERLLTLLAVLPFCVSCGSGDSLVVSGWIEFRDIHVGSRVGGRVTQVLRQEGDSARAGDPLVLLDDAEIQAQLAEANAALAKTQAELNMLLAGSRKEDIARAEAVVAGRRADHEMLKNGFRPQEIHRAEAMLKQAQAEADLTEKNFVRTDSLFKTQTVNQRDLDQARAAMNDAKALVEARRQDLALQRSGSRNEEIAAAAARVAEAKAEADKLRNGARTEEIEAAKAEVRRMQSHIEMLKTTLSEMRIAAPEDSSIETLDLEPGDLVKPGQPIAVLTIPSTPYVRCFVPENRLGEVAPGAEVRIAVDSLPGQDIRGKIRRVNRQSEFTPRNVQTSEKRAELVYEMKADVIQGGENLRSGMYADVYISKSGKQ